MPKENEISVYWALFSPGRANKKKVTAKITWG
jgi:hypothetical protein